MTQECLLSPLQRQRHSRLEQAGEGSSALQPAELAQVVGAVPVQVYGGGRAALGETRHCAMGT